MKQFIVITFFIFLSCVQIKAQKILERNQNGEVSFEVKVVSENFIIGMTPPVENADANNIAYALVVSNSKLFVLEYGSVIMDAGSISKNDSIVIKRDGDHIKYYKNDFNIRNIVTNSEYELQLIKIGNDVPEIKTNFKEKLSFNVEVENINDIKFGKIKVFSYGGREPYSLIWEDNQSSDFIRTVNEVNKYKFTLSDAAGHSISDVVYVGRDNSERTMSRDAELNKEIESYSTSSFIRFDGVWEASAENWIKFNIKDLRVKWSFHLSSADDSEEVYLYWSQSELYLIQNDKIKAQYGSLKENSEILIFSNEDNKFTIIKDGIKLDEISVLDSKLKLSFKFYSKGTGIKNFSTSKLKYPFKIITKRIDFSCDNEGFIYVNIEGEGEEYQFLWTDENGDFLSNESSINNLAQGLYYLSVTDQNGSVVSETYNLNEDILYSEFWNDNLPSQGFEVNGSFLNSYRMISYITSNCFLKLNEDGYVKFNPSEYKFDNEISIGMVKQAISGHNQIEYGFNLYNNNGSYSYSVVCSGIEVSGPYHISNLNHDFKVSRLNNQMKFYVDGVEVRQCDGNLNSNFYASVSQRSIEEPCAIRDIYTSFEDCSCKNLEVVDAQNESGIWFNNFGTKIKINSNTFLNVYGNVLNEKVLKVNNLNLIYESGTFKDEGDLRIKINWINNSFIPFENTLSQGRFIMFGFDQIISGSESTNFPNLILENNSVKHVLTDASTCSSCYLNLTNAELSLESSNFIVYSSSILSIIRQSGFVSTDINSYLSRKVSASDYSSSPIGGSISLTDNSIVNQYIFPLGSSSNFLRYRPAGVQSTYDNTLISMALINNSPNMDNLDISNKLPEIEQVNNEYYYKLKHNSWINNIYLSFFTKQSENINTILHWEQADFNNQAVPYNELWVKEAKLGMVLNNLTAASVPSTILGQTFDYNQNKIFPLSSEFDKRIIANEISNFNSENFNIGRAGFLINTSGFGDPDADGVFSDYIISSSGNNIPIGGVSSVTGSGNDDGSDGDLYIQDSGGNTTYTIELIETIDISPVIIEFTVDEFGNIIEDNISNPVTINGNEPSEDVIEIINGSTIHIIGVPSDLNPECESTFTISFTNNDLLEINGVDYTNISLKNINGNVISPNSALINGEIYFYEVFNGSNLIFQGQIIKE